METIPEILLIDKPSGKTSFDVIRILRRRLGIKKIGHAGTLDPLATGLMVIGIGAGTKQLNNFVKLDKEYVAEVLVGESRATGDMEGEVLAEKVVTESNQEMFTLVSSALVTMVGELNLSVSAYSAIKVAGVPMYKKAREAERGGEVVVEVPVRLMKVYEVELLKVETLPTRAIATIRFKVSSGTYIRSLAEELGRKIGYPATVKSLRRTKIGEFEIEQAQALEEIK